MRYYDLELEHKAFEKDVVTSILDPRTPLLHAHQPCDFIRVFRIAATFGGLFAAVFLLWKLTHSSDVRDDFYN